MTCNLDFTSLNDLTEKSLFYYDLPGLALQVDFEEKSFTTTAGYQDFPSRRPLRKDHIFHMASLTKLFVGTGILQQVERGILNLTDRLSDLLPWFTMADPAFSRITLTQLLSHSSGMPDVKDYGWDHPETDEGALKRYLTSKDVASAHLLWPPEDGRFAYSNIGYELLGTILAETSGSTFEDYVEENIFAPLEMESASLLTFQRDPATLCTPHEKNDAKEIIPSPHFPYNRAHAPSSTLTASITDLSQWAAVHLNTSFLQRESYEKMWAPHATVPNNEERVGLSWFIRKQEGVTLYGHEGTDDGFRASFWICPELNLHISVCSNLSGAPTKRIAKQVLRMLLDS